MTFWAGLVVGVVLGAAFVGGCFAWAILRPPPRQDDWGKRL